MSETLEPQRQNPTPNLESETYYGLKEIKIIADYSVRPPLDTELNRIVNDTEDSLCSRFNVSNLVERGVCYVSLQKGIKSCSIPEVNGDLLANLTSRFINLVDGSFITATEALRNSTPRCPRFWIVLINCYMVDFDDAIFNFFSKHLTMATVEESMLKKKIRNGKCILVTRWNSEDKKFEIVSCVLFAVGNEFILCPYIATSSHQHLPKYCGPSADGYPYRRRGLVRVLLAHLQLMTLNVFCWPEPRLVLQADPLSLGPIECFKKLGFRLLDYQYFMDDPIPDLNEEAVPFKFESRLWKMFIQDSQKIRYGAVNPDSRYFRFYMTSTLVAGGDSRSKTIVRKKMIPLEDFLAARHSLDMHWMQDLRLVARDSKGEPVPCCVGKKCMHFKNGKEVKPAVHQYAFCMYCKKGCHPECCYSREDGYDACVPIDMFHAYRPPEVYGTCLLCFSKMKDGKNCKHNVRIDRSGNGVMTVTCNKQYQTIHPRHRCLR